MKRLQTYPRHLAWSRRLRRTEMGLACLALSVLGLAGCGASLTEPTATEAYRVAGMAPASQEQVSRPSAGGVSASGATTPATPVPAGAEASVTGGAVAKAITAAATPGNAAYKIGPLDVLDVSVFKVPELSKTVQVADSGTVNLPLVGEVQAVGLTAQDVERDLTKKLGAKYLQNPQVTVFVKEYNSQRVTIEGAVKKPGVYPIKGRSSLLQLIATAEGLTEVAEDEVAIFREVDGKRTAAKFNIDDIRSGKAQDPGLYQGDTVVVSTSALAQSYQNLLKAIPLGTFALML